MPKVGDPGTTKHLVHDEPPYFGYNFANEDSLKHTPLLRCANSGLWRHVFLALVSYAGNSSTRRRAFEAGVIDGGAGGSGSGVSGQPDLSGTAKPGYAPRRGILGAHDRDRGVRRLVVRVEAGAYGTRGHLRRRLRGFRSDHTGRRNIRRGAGRGGPSPLFGHRLAASGRARSRRSRSFRDRSGLQLAEGFRG